MVFSLKNRWIRRNTLPVRVNLLVCGTQKGGTSALDEYLRAHPQICMATKKEVHYFDDEQAHLESSPDYATYHRHFKPEPKHTVIGETTPIYMYWRESPKRIWQYNPGMKLVLMLRNPIERAYSQWNMARLSNSDTLSFGEAIRCEKVRSSQALPLQHRLYSYVDRGFYVEQIERLTQYFPAEQLLILKYDDFRSAPLHTMQKVFAFLGVEPLKDIDCRNVHALPYHSTIRQAERDYLRTIYAQDIRALERMLDWDCTHWLSDECHSHSGALTQECSRKT